MVTKYNQVQCGLGIIGALLPTLSSGRLSAAQSQWLFKQRAPCPRLPGQFSGDFVLAPVFFNSLVNHDPNIFLQINLSSSHPFLH